MILNLFNNIPQNLPEELFNQVLRSGTTRIERIVSRGHCSPPDFWYDQTEHEWVLLLKGQARVQLPDVLVRLMPGDHLNIPAHLKHRVDWTTPDEDTIWLAVFYQD